MPDLHHLLLFIAAGLLLNLTPGPDVMFIVASAVRGGLRAGVAAALGIGAGCLVHVAAAALGVSALLLASGTALAALKWLGALYLVWMGAQMLRAALCPVASKKIAAGAELAPAAASFDAEPPEGAQRRRRHVHQAAGANAQRRRHAHAQAAAHRAGDDEHHVRPRRQVEQQAGSDEQQQVVQVGHGAFTLRSGSGRQSPPVRRR